MEMDSSWKMNERKEERFVVAVGRKREVFTVTVASATSTTPGHDRQLVIQLTHHLHERHKKIEVN